MFDLRSSTGELFKKQWTTMTTDEISSSMRGAPGIPEGAAECQSWHYRLVETGAMANGSMSLKKVAP